MIRHICSTILVVSNVLLILFLSACQKKQETRTDYGMGERASVGRMTYTVVESTWKTQLGESFRARTPAQRFLLIKLSVTNGSGQDISIPLLTLDGDNGQTYREIADGNGVDNWFGVLRTISAGQTQQGNVLFDVPLASYKLRVPDINDTGFDGYARIEIPLHLESDLPIQSPINPNDLK